MKPAKGFTLLELLLAVALSAFVLAVSYQFFNLVKLSGRSAVENFKLQGLIPPFFYLFLRDIESANQNYGGFKVYRDLDGNLEGFEFTTENCYYFKGICTVKYWLYRGRGGKRYLFRSEYDFNSPLKAVSFPLSFKNASLELFTLSGGNWVKFNGGRVNLLKVLIEFKGEGVELPLVFKVRT